LRRTLLLISFWRMQIMSALKGTPISATKTAKIASAKFAQFRLDKRGSVAIIFGMMAVPVFMMLGVAVDYSRIVTARSAAQAALDAAAFAGTIAAQASPNTAATSANTAASAYFSHEVIPNSVQATLSQPTINSSAGTYSWTASVWVSTPFISAAGILFSKSVPSGAPAGCTGSGWVCQNISLNSTATMQASGNNTGYNIETALILDLSGSMGDDDGTGTGTTKIQSLRTAANNLAQILVWSDQSQYTSKIALAPYQMGVNVGSTYATTVRGPITAGTSTTPGSTNYTFTPASSNQQQNDNYSGGQPYAINSGGSYVTTPGYYYYNSHNTITQSISNCVSERTGTHAFDDAAPSTAYVGLNYPDPNNPCQSPVITPLTNNLTTLTTNINSLNSGGSTAAQVGVAWGWYMLSPNWASIFPAASQPQSYSMLTQLNSKGSPMLRKIAVLMTDGGWNSTYCNGVISADSTYGSGNESTHINCNAPNGSTFTQAAQICTNMKAAGIELYTVAFLVGTTDSTVTNALQACATNSSHYFLATNGSALQSAFKAIALQVQSLHLTQ
jgi:Flp pilus assembly protein TadG